MILESFHVFVPFSINNCIISIVNNVFLFTTVCNAIIQSCSKAYEYKGFLMENDQRYKDAAEQYELAWKLSYCIDPAIGKEFIVAQNFHT